MVNIAGPIVCPVYSQFGNRIGMATVTADGMIAVTINAEIIVDIRDLLVTGLAHGLTLDPTINIARAVEEPDATSERND